MALDPRFSIVPFRYIDQTACKSLSKSDKNGFTSFSIKNYVLTWLRSVEICRNFKFNQLSISQLMIHLNSFLTLFEDYLLSKSVHLKETNKGWGKANVQKNCSIKREGETRMAKN